MTVATTLKLPKASVPGGLGGSLGMSLEGSYDDSLMPVSSSSSAAAVIGAVAVMGLLRSILYDVGEGTLGEGFALLNRQSWRCLRGPSGMSRTTPGACSECLM